MAESLRDKLYAQLCEDAHTKEPEKDPIFLKSLLSLVCFFLYIGILTVGLIVLDYYLKRSPRKDMSTPKDHMVIELVQNNN